MKNPNNKGFDQHYNVQVAVDQEKGLNSNHQRPARSLAHRGSELGTPPAAALDNGYFSKDNIDGLLEREVDPYIATGRNPHHRSWQSYFEQLPEPPDDDATLTEKMA